MIDPHLKLLLVPAVVAYAVIGPWSPPGSFEGAARPAVEPPQEQVQSGQEPGHQDEQGPARQGEQGTQTQGEASEEEQDPQERFAIAERERLGDEGQRLRIGLTELIFTDIMEFRDAVNDLFFWGRLPTVAGTVDDNAFVGGQTVVLREDGTVGGDLFVFAQTARIEGNVGGDVYAFVADLAISPAGRVGGAVYGGSGSIRIDGTIEGPLNFAAGGVVINGTIMGDVSLEAGKLELGPEARIEGELRYESAAEADVHPDAQVLGEIRHFIPASSDEEGEEETAASGWFSVWSIAWACWWFLSSFVVGALLLAVGGDTARRPTECLTRQPALGLGFGFVIAVVVLAGVIISIFLLITIPLAVLGFLAYLIAIYVARLVTAQTVGHWLLTGLRSLGARYGVMQESAAAEPSAYLSLALGLVLFYFLTKIPFLGFIFWLLAICLGLGGIYLAMRGRSDDGIVAAVPPSTMTV